MIAYEELERALARWKHRHAAGADAESEAEVISESAAPHPESTIDESRTPMPVDNTGEIDLDSAVVEEI